MFKEQGRDIPLGKFGQVFYFVIQTSILTFAEGLNRGKVDENVN